MSHFTFLNPGFPSGHSQFSQVPNGDFFATCLPSRWPRVRIPSPYTPETRNKIFEAAERIAKQTGAALRAEVTFETLYGSPPVINNPGVADWVAGMASAVVGESNVGEHDPVSVGDDMAEFINRAPGCYFLLGASKEGAENHHNARFDFDEACLPIGIEVFVRAALDYLA